MLPCAPYPQIINRLRLASATVCVRLRVPGFALFKVAADRFLTETERSRVFSNGWPSEACRNTDCSLGVRGARESMRCPSPTKCSRRTAAALAAI
jgi:hypothetical protein